MASLSLAKLERHLYEAADILGTGQGRSAKIEAQLMEKLERWGTLEAKPYG